MSLTDRLGQFFDVFSRRQRVHGPGYKPPTISRDLHAHILMLYSEVISGRLNTRPWGYAEDHSVTFFAQMHQALRLLYGRANLANQRQRSDAEDIMAFTNECTAERLFDFIEASFKLDVSSRIFGDENEFVAALNDIIRRDGAPFQILPGVTREQPEQHYVSIVRVAFPRVARVDEEIAHIEAIVPALSALADPVYAGADDEFRRALQDYRVGDYADCLGKCGSAFESVLKVLCKKNGITVQVGKDTAGHLIPLVLAKSTLDAGTFQEPLTLVARMRNRLSSSHGGDRRYGPSTTTSRSMLSPRPPPPSYFSCRTSENDAPGGWARVPSRDAGLSWKRRVPNVDDEPVALGYADATAHGEALDPSGVPVNLSAHSCRDSRLHNVSTTRVDCG